MIVFMHALMNDVQSWDVFMAAAVAYELIENELFIDCTDRKIENRSEIAGG